MRVSGVTNCGHPSVVVALTNSRIACLAGPSFHEPSGSSARARLELSTANVATTISDLTIVGFILSGVVLNRKNAYAWDYLPISSTALRNGALDALMNPSKGRFISKIKKIAEETDNAQMSSTVSTTPLEGANSPKLTKRPVSQKTSTTMNVAGRLVCWPSITSKRVCNTSSLICNACARRDF